MEKFYQGPVKLKEFKAKITTQADRANISCQYQLFNPEDKVISLKTKFIKSGLSDVKVRKIDQVRIKPVFISTSTKLNFIEKEISTKLNALDRQVIDLDYTTAILGSKTKSLQLVPELNIDGDDFVQKVQTYEVEIELPAEAKKLVASNLNPSRIVTKDGKLNCYFSFSDTYLIPIFLKWSELDVDVNASKSARLLAGNQMEVTIIIQNNRNNEIKNLVLSDDYSISEVEPLPSQPNIIIESPFDKSSRIKYQVKLDLKAKEKKTLKYKLKIKGNKIKVADSNITYQNELIAIATCKIEFHLPPPFIPPSCAFALPSGWSFDYLHGGDHHLNEEGIWSYGQFYDKARERLSWSTGCIFADKNLDDDYRWSVNHQVVRFNPGFSYFEQTPWLAKTGSVSTHNGVFRHESLKLFPNAIILIAGWRFDFTSGDHHINKIFLNISNIVFNRTNGEIKWKTQVTYADKNFDDNYRYMYNYIILGFNGEIKFIEFSGTDNGGTTLHNGSITDNVLKNYKHAMVFPQSWSFNFKSNDHHINEHSFRIFNVSYETNTGKLTWKTNLNYSDKNFDDDYYWGYKVAVVVSNFGESRELTRGPYTDNGGYDNKSYLESLNGIFIPITWTNGICDGDETGVDCGGSSPAKNMNCISGNIDPGTAASSNLFSIRNANDRYTVRTFATVALMEYVLSKNQDFNTFYSGVNRPDRYVEAIAAYVNNHMRYVADGNFGGAQSAIDTLTNSGHRGPGNFNGDCEDHAILRAALLRSLGFSKYCIFCADHHNSYDQGQNEECFGDKKGGGHTFNVVIYKGKYRILDYGNMQCRYWANKQAWNQHVVDNIWNDHTGKHWSQKDVSPFGSSSPLVNYPGNPSCPSSNWDWRTYFCDVTL
ncbi:MAG: hypothetical protein JXB00_02300 [Bacteroidales bacterium]|nr:hypothetical protein [Bacteroidales bacterium]